MKKDRTAASDQSERARRMAIITESYCFDGVGNQYGKTILILVMVYTSGAERGEEIEKRYEFEGNPPEYLKREMLRIGFRVEQTEQLKKVVDQLVGFIVRVSLLQSGDTLRVYIDDYFGRDDPKKYTAKR